MSSTLSFRTTARRGATVLAAALVALSTTSCASSQDTRNESARSRQGGRAQQDNGERLERQIASLGAAVDLTPEQTTRVRTLLTAQAADRPDGPPRGRQSGPPARGGQNDDRRAQMEARRAETDRQIEAILTPDQVTSFRAWRASQPTGPQRPQRGGE